MDFFEDLGTAGITCPHEDAYLPNGTTVYYRKVATHPATSSDFLPNLLREAPDKCIAKAVSLFDNKPALENIFKAPALKKKRPVKIVSVILTPNCGKLKQTFSAGHHSFWRSAAFIPENCSPQIL